MLFLGDLFEKKKEICLNALLLLHFNLELEFGQLFYTRGTTRGYSPGWGWWGGEGVGVVCLQGGRSMGIFQILEFVILFAGVSRFLAIS